MKKTLITLAALAMASVAQAAEASWSATEPTGAAQVTFGTNNAYTLFMIVDWDKLAAASTAHPGTEIGKTTDYQSQTHEIHMWRDDEDTVLASIHIDTNQVTGSMTAGEGGTVQSSKHNYILDKDEYGLTIDGESKLIVALTFTNITAKEAGGYTGTVTLYAVKNDFTVGSAYVTDSDLSANFNRITFDSTAGVVSEASFFNVALSDTEISELAAKAVPEPATATLSLLALAGLAARRRRK